MSEIQEVSGDKTVSSPPKNESESLIQKIFNMLKNNSIFVVSLLVALVAFFYIKRNDASQVLNDSFSPEMVA